MTEKNKLTQKSEKIGKAIARTSFKAESAGKAVKKKAEDIVGKVSKKAKTTVSKVGHLKPAAKKGKAKGKNIFKPKNNLVVIEQMGLTAGDIYHYLQSNGEVTTEKLINAMKRRKNTQAMACAALGWLAREDKVVFDKEGITVRLVS